MGDIATREDQVNQLAAFDRFDERVQNDVAAVRISGFDMESDTWSQLTAIENTVPIW